MNEYKIKNIVTDILDAILDFIYPENINCILCNSPIDKSNTYSMCKTCFDEMHFITDGCVKCGKAIVNYSLDEQNIENCLYCKNKNFYFDKSISCIEYSDLSKKLVFKLKYSNKTYISKYIAQIMNDKLDLENIDIDYISFVPLHKSRLRKRGFNQAEKIAHYLSKIIDRPIVNNINRKIKTQRLYKLGSEERKEELKNVFLINEESCDIRGKNILLVDDIFTTGATVNEVSKMLKLKSSNKVYVITLITGTNK